MNALTPKEVTAIQMALDGMIEDLETTGKNPNIPFTPEARQMHKEILSNAKSAHAKIAAASGMLIKLDPFKEGDQDEFLTKES